MRELIELQTGQVAFISAVMSGFSLSVAANVLRHGIRSVMSQTVFIMLVLSSLSFLLALYVDVRLSIELADRDNLSEALSARVSEIRTIGTLGATFAFFLFVAAIGLLGWLATPFVGIVTTVMSAVVLGLLSLAWLNIAELITLLPA